jgi:hypothetical protein
LELAKTGLKLIKKCKPQNEKSKVPFNNLSNRLLKFALSVIRFIEELNKSSMAVHIGH